MRGGEPLGRRISNLTYYLDYLHGSNLRWICNQKNKSKLRIWCFFRLGRETGHGAECNRKEPWKILAQWDLDFFQPQVECFGGDA